MIYFSGNVTSFSLKQKFLSYYDGNLGINWNKIKTNCPIHGKHNVYKNIEVMGYDWAYKKSLYKALFYVVLKLYNANY